MIPLLALLRVGRRGRRGFPLWIPLFLVWLLLAPLALLLLLPFVIVCRALRLKPLLALAVGWQLLCGLRSTRVEVQSRQSCVVLRFV